MRAAAGRVRPQFGSEALPCLLVPPPPHIRSPRREALEEGWGLDPLKCRRHPTLLLSWLPHPVEGISWLCITAPLCLNTISVQGRMGKAGLDTKKSPRL